MTLDELAISNMWETSALVELLERKGILTKQEVLHMIQELRQREPSAIPPRRFGRHESCQADRSNRERLLGATYIVLRN